MTTSSLWLVRHSTDCNAATVGLALLAADWAEDDIPRHRRVASDSRPRTDFWHGTGSLSRGAERTRREGQ